MVGRTLKDIFCGELVDGKWITDRPQLRLVNVCKRDIRALDIDIESRACLEADHTRWRSTQNSKIKSKTPVRRGEADEGRGQRQTRGHAEKGAATPLDQRPRTSVTFEAVTFTLTCVAAWIGGRFAEGMW